VRIALFSILVCGSVLRLAVPALSAQTDHNTQKRVLVFTALRNEAALPALVERDVLQVLHSGLAGHVDYYSESIDLARFQEADYQLALRDFIGRKYRGLRFDLVIAIGDACLDFVDQNRDALFPATPVVFAASPGKRRGANSTGVFLGLDLTGTIALATTLQPDTTQVFVVTGASAYDAFYEKLARAQLRQFEGQLSIEYLTGLAIPDLERQLSHLPPHSIVYYLSVTEDGAGGRFLPHESLDRLARAANAPTYSFVEIWMEHGIVGGSLLSLQNPVRHAADRALRVLRGENADQIPTTEIDPNIRQVDWRQLRRWGIPEARVPAGTSIRFREIGPWDRYKFYVIGAISLLFVQSALIAGLLVQRARRRRAEEGMRRSKAELRTSHARAGDLARRLITEQEAERRRIARELHDDVGQQLALLSIDLEQLARSAHPSHGDTLQRARAASQRTAEISTSVHDMSHQLHPPKLELIGLVVALTGLQRELSLQHAMQIDFTHRDVPAALPRDVALCLFRIAQEGLRNAIRHSGARAVSVQLTGDGQRVALVIADEGSGFDVDATGHVGLGLLSMRERVESVGGTLTIRANPGTGTHLEVSVPIARGQPTA
jgi:signal transduction histidine kinase